MSIQENGTAKKMIAEFERQFNEIINDYRQNKISTTHCIHSLNWLRTSWGVLRVDIKNSGKHNKLASFSYTEGTEVQFPGWFNDEQGQGALIRLTELDNKIQFHCVNEGNVKFSFRGGDYKNNKNERQPILFNYTKITINNNNILKDNKIAWHDKPIMYNMKCKDDEKINLEINWENIYNYFPALKAHLLNINNKNLDTTINDVLNYFDNQKQLNEIKSLETTVQLLNKRNEELFLKLAEQQNETNQIIDSYNFLFNTLFKYNKIEPKKLVKQSRELNMQLLDFIENVCKKYNLQWWLYGGTLLGAIRHKGFIPWDDDCDIKMMREDYEKFLQIIGHEIEEHNLTGVMEANTTTKTIDDVFLPFIKLNYWVDKHLYAFIDIFPTEYLKTEVHDLKTVFRVETNRMVGRLRAGEDRKTVINEASERLGVSKTKTNRIICGIEDSILAVHDYDTVFPLTKIQFENREYPCPNHYIRYISELYGDDYLQIPKVIYAHGFYDYLSRHNNVYDRMDEHIRKLDEINRNF
ncbi:LicD family protein [Methanosphaera sp. ISO3-F5]|uniref:LicD family protein n=1 Tax=Methanosphaera sp. ISO3-F5 TaxID=1452353 RepID=UPI002B260FDB|nr:LicD family protein [Methanosphaera sp. ISO3-F5]WQH63457.1 LicD family protein [Methanosphaera sp. ISO3-F5]